MYFITDLSFSFLNSISWKDATFWYFICTCIGIIQVAPNLCTKCCYRYYLFLHPKNILQEFPFFDRFVTARVSLCDGEPSCSLYAANLLKVKLPTAIRWDRCYRPSILLFPVNASLTMLIMVIGLYSMFKWRWCHFVSGWDTGICAEELVMITLPHKHHKNLLYNVHVLGHFGINCDHADM